MGTNIKVLLWNIQNYGKKKVSFSDVMSAIAKTVNAYSPDIFVLLELNTTKLETATDLCQKMSNYLYKASGNQHYRISLKSLNTGKEFYAVFIKDATVTRPVAPFLNTDGSLVKFLGHGKTSFSEVTFKCGATPASGISCLTALPFVIPDRAQVQFHGRKLDPPEWAGNRYPCLSMFWCKDASGRDRLFTLFICHYVANAIGAKKQLDQLRFFNILGGLGVQPDQTRYPNFPMRKPLKLKCEIDGVGMDINVPVYVLAGDYNIDYNKQKDYYLNVNGAEYPSLGAIVLNSEINTHLMYPKDYKRLRPKNDSQLAVSNFDNFMMREDPANKTPAQIADLKVNNLPTDIRNGYHKLKESVAHYAELDQRGFSAGDYKDIALDFQNQLQGGGDINRVGGLVGARLISDHKAVIATFTLD